MPIRVKTPDGYATFPDGTPDGEIERALAETYKPGRQIGMTEAFGRGALQGATFGFSDELGGMIPGQPFGSQEEISKANQLAREQNPGSYLTGELASAVLPGGPVARGAGFASKVLGRAAPEAGRISHGAAQGAGVGGLFGAGTAEGGLEERAKGAAIGAGVGGALGGVAAPAVDVVSGLGRGLKNTFRLGSEEARGRQKVAEALVRDRVPGTTVKSREIGGVIGSLSRRLGEAREAGAPVMLADFGGKNTQKLLRAAQNQSSTGAQKLTQQLDRRQFFQNERMTRALGEALGDPKKFTEATAGLVEARKTAAKEMFDKAFATETPLTPQLQKVLNRPAMQRVIKEASTRLQNEGQQVQGLSSTRLLHLMKMEIDDMLSAATRAAKMGNRPTAGIDKRTLTILKNDLVNSMDNPAYKDALKKFSGDKALENALEEGADQAFKMNPSELARKMAAMNESERELFQLGAVRAITDRMAEIPRNNDRVRRFLSSPAVDQRLRALIPDNVARRSFQKAIELEKRFTSTRRAAQGNSTTAEQLASGGEGARGVGMIEAADVGKKALTADVGGLALSLAKGAANKFTGFTPRTANSVLEALMSDGAQVSPALLRALRRADQAPAKRAAIAKALTRGAGAGAGASLTGGIGPRYDEYGNLRPGQR